MENDMVGFRVYADHRQSLDYYGHRNYKMDIAETAFYTTQEQRDKGYGVEVHCLQSYRLISFSDFSVSPHR